MIEDREMRLCPLWVISGHPATYLFTSAIGGKAVARELPSGCPLIARSGHRSPHSNCARAVSEEGIRVQVGQPVKDRSIVGDHLWRGDVMRNKLTVTVTAAIVAVIFPIGFSPAEGAKPMVTQGVFSVPVSRIEVGQDWNTRGYDCSISSVGSGWRSSNHVHHSDEVVTTVEGRVALVIGKQRFEAGPGDELFLPSNTMHREENTNTSKMVSSSDPGRLEVLWGLKHAVGAPPNRCN